MADIPEPISDNDKLLHHIIDGTPDITDMVPTSREEKYLKYIALNGTGGGGGESECDITIISNNSEYKLGTIWETGKTFPQDFKIVYGNGVFVLGCTGYGSTNRFGIYYSQNGLKWEQSNITTGTILALTYEGGMFFSYKDELLYSLDGKIWTNSLSVTVDSSGGVTYDNDIYVLGCNSGLYYSNNGITWTRSNITTGKFYKPKYIGGIWFSDSYDTGTKYSLDGKTWNNTSDAIDVKSMSYSNGIYVANYQNNGIRYSLDGINWLYTNINQGSYSSLLYGKDLWLCSLSNYNTYLWYSTNGETWIKSNLPSSTYKIFYNNEDTFICYSIKKGIYYSTDGKIWNESNIIFTDGLTYSFNSILYYDGLWIISYGQHGILYSTDGKIWIQSNVTNGYTLNTIVKGDNIIISPYTDSTDSSDKTIYSKYYLGFSAKISGGSSYIGIDISEHLTDINNYTYIPIVISSDGYPINSSIDINDKKIYFSRGVGISTSIDINIEYKIMKIKNNL